MRHPEALIKKKTGHVRFSWEIAVLGVQEERAKQEGEESDAQKAPSIRRHFNEFRNAYIIDRRNDRASWRRQKETVNRGSAFHQVFSE